MTDLYEILGVRRNATADTIKKAYRKRSRDHHPDRGGDADAFRALQTAYEVLSDPVRRKTYDETGAFDPNAGVDHDLPVVIQFLHNGLMEVLQNYEQMRVEPEKRDLIKDMIDRFREGQKTRADAMKNFRRGQTVLDRVIKRLKVKEGEANLLADVARSKRAELEKVIVTTAAEIEYMTKAIKILENHEFDWDRPTGQTAAAGFKNFDGRVVTMLWEFRG